jgi:hypothetical protein
MKLPSKIKYTNICKDVFPVLCIFTFVYGLSLQGTCQVTLQNDWCNNNVKIAKNPMSFEK